jgi:hypothetical protein
MELNRKLKDITLENTELKSVLIMSAKTQNELASELIDIKTRYNECLDLLHSTQDDLRTLRNKYISKREAKTLKAQRKQFWNLYSPWMGANSFAAEVHFEQHRNQAVNM